MNFIGTMFTQPMDRSVAKCPGVRRRSEAEAPHSKAFGLLAALAGFLALTISAHAATVSETATEFLSSGDFNGDGRTDAIVLDKATGNARVGYQNANGALTWAAPVPSGVARAGSLAVGRFIQINRDAIAVTSFEFNRVAQLGNDLGEDFIFLLLGVLE